MPFFLMTKWAWEFSAPILKMQGNTKSTSLIWLLHQERHYSRVICLPHTSYTHRWLCKREIHGKKNRQVCKAAEEQQ